MSDYSKAATGCFGSQALSSSATVALGVQSCKRISFAGGTEMCGIAAIIKLMPPFPFRDELHRFNELQASRGPDDSGILIDTNVGLANTRLAIVDPSGATQPMTNEDESIWVTFNGEIFNAPPLRSRLERQGHHFKTAHSDTEVIVHGYEEWGFDLPLHLDGMYGAALYDAKAKQLLIFRDRLGIKPLFLARLPTAIIAASTINGIAHHPIFAPHRHLDKRALEGYLRWKYVPSPLTIFTKIRKLQPAERVLICTQTGNVLSSDIYWKPQWRQDKELDKESSVDLVIQSLKNAITAVTPQEQAFGIMLSGGIDSAVVAAATCLYTQKMPTAFSIGFDQPIFDELSYAQTVATSLRMPHVTDILTAVSLKRLPKIVMDYGQPFADASQIPTAAVCDLAHNCGLKILLSGDGGDELFAGYATYFRILDQLVQTPNANLLDLHEKYVGHFTLAEINAMYKPQFECEVPWDPRVDLVPDPSLEPLLQLQLIDLGTYLPDDLLYKVDVAGMATSVEVRPPLLHNLVVDAALKIPPALNLRNINHPEILAQGKAILAQVATTMLPGFNTRRPKMGFGYPHASYLRLEATSIRNILVRSEQLNSIFEQRSISQLIDSHQNSITPYGFAHKLWNLLVLHLWWSANTDLSLS
jgi:asparagine synthase (glutamine-hydrolysing)